jgi:hypothetical protein
MSSERITYQNWIVELGHDPDLPPVIPGENPLSEDRTQSVRERVSAAMDRLDEQEREFVILFHYQGKTYRSISASSGRPVHRLETLHHRALKKLKRELAGWVELTYGIPSLKNADCSLCNCSERSAIDQLIAERNPRESWKPVLDQLRERFGLTISSPQLVIGHEKYHL